MQGKFIVRSISIRADLGLIQEILTDYKYIKKWENQLNSWKELHISDGKMTINHWDIEDDIDYVFKLKDMYDTVSLELKIGDLSKQPDGGYSIHKAQEYANTVMNRIKELSENMSWISFLID